MKTTCYLKATSNASSRSWLLRAKAGLRYIAFAPLPRQLASPCCFSSNCRAARLCIRSQAAASRHTCEVKEEIEELRLYYNMQMSDIISQMQAMYKQQRTPGTEELLKETKRVLTDNYMFEETVLPTLPCSNAGLYAMNLHYSTSLESLNIMLKQMESMEDFNRNSKQ